MYYILHAFKQEFVVYLPLIFIIFGVVGFIGNTFTFLQSTLRFNSCCIYLLCGSFVDVINLLSNYLHSTTDYTLSLITIRYVCKLKLFSFFLPQLSINFLILSLIDRFASTCSLTSSIRHIRQLELVPSIILVAIIISSIMSFYGPFYYDIVTHIGCTRTDRFL
ncbi:unnamed protein product [Rotaria magnacalcarata]|uniref:G-protein coupled receptors family 1 profile domain-containing protein n=1 Tax=Rotaria magnacalcarata TaxID=392030 RepID=A0A816MGG6_9BILA|nr:unnamed protein product [Rotaria magnacalcarata]CAF4053738.1 unnamed protein product [Rotaria magnacalcarata]